MYWLQQNHCCPDDSVPAGTVYVSVAVLAEISLRSPRKVFILITKKISYRIKVSEKKIHI